MKFPVFLAGWIAGVLPVCSQAADPGSALQFDGATTYVEVDDHGAFNVFPFTVSAWFRTTNSATLFQGLASHYVDATANGFFLLLQNGKLRGYYSAAPGHLAIDATAAVPSADGFWHHAALAVDSFGGRLYLDGVQVGTGTWNGATGAPTTAAPFLIGDYWKVPDVLQGTMDEVALWNRALGGAEVNYLQHRQLNGNEDGLLALWHFDDGSGTSANNATGHGYNGTLQNNPAWIASTAPLVFNQVAGTALKFSGGGDYVSVPDDPALDAFPLTVMAWVRTSRVGTPPPMASSAGPTILF